MYNVFLLNFVIFANLLPKIAKNIRPDEHCSPAVETSPFDDVFCQPICGW